MLRQFRRLLTTTEYNKVSETAMNNLLDSFELIEQGTDCDVEYAAGVLTVKMKEIGTYVINKQPPNKQIWLSSPISGPKRYDYFDNKWVYLRDKVPLDELLSKELSEELKTEIKINI